jgi:serine/threonine-protein kinase
MPLAREPGETIPFLAGVTMSETTTIHHESNDRLDAALQAAFGSGSGWGGESMLLALPLSSGVGRPRLLRGEPAEPDEMPDGGRYRVADEIGRGGIGVVLRGRDRDLGREVALKVLRDEHAANPAMVRRLVEEAQIGGQLQHPGVPPVFEIGLDPAHRPFFAMQLLRGRTLADLLAERPDPEADRHRFLGIVEGVAQTMAYAHARGVIHRDLKPSNVMVGDFGEVRVVDWGLAKVLHAGPEEGGEPPPTGDPAPHRSEAGSVLGTPGYMPPEQARGEIAQLDERCDVFALGAILCEVLTGQPPLAGPRAEVLRRSAAGDFGEALRRLEACQADADLVSLARRCLDADPAGRPRDASAVAAELGGYLARVEQRARAAELDAAAARARAEAERRSRRRVMTLGGALMIAGALGALGFHQAERQRWKAEEQRLRAIQAERSRLESALAVLLPMEMKTRHLLEGAEAALDRDAGYWAGLLMTCQAVAERAAATAPDEETRQRFGSLAQQLSDQVAELRRKIEGRGRLAPENPARKPAGP